MMSSCKTQTNLPLIATPEEESELLANAIKKLARSDSPLEILEAGCGNAWLLDLGDLSYRLTGLDLDADALRIRQTERKDLHEAIIGDLHTVDLKGRQYDVIFNSFVLEHVTEAEKILDNFYEWLRPGGILILKLPDRESVYGFITRTTPHWVHVMYKKYVEGVKNAGKPGYTPYRTIYEKVVSRTGIREWAAKRGLAVSEEFGANYFVDGLGLLTLPIKTIIRSVNILSRGDLAADHTNLTYVLIKPEKAAQPTRK